MKLPNFLIIGAGKSGTTSVYHYLKQHPQVYMSPIKETNFFAYGGKELRQEPRDDFPIKSLEEYSQLFDGVQDHKAIGEASPRYLIDGLAPRRIHSLLPEVKLIGILRNPVDRAYSAYSMLIREGRERRSFAQAIQEEERGDFTRNLEWGQRRYLAYGYYARQLKAYLKIFDKNQLAIYLFEDLDADPNGFMEKIYRFLDVNDEFVADTSVRYNPSGAPKNKILTPILLQKKGSFRTRVTGAVRRMLPRPVVGYLLAVQRKWQSQQLVKTPMTSEIREKLILKYRDDILHLQDLLQRDLSHWLK